MASSPHQTSSAHVTPAHPTEPIETEVVIIGGGASGLAASIALARSRRRVVVIDAGEPRNAPAHGAHNVLGNEGIAPGELITRGRGEAESYGVQFLDGVATDAQGTIDDFTIEIDGGAQRVHSRRVILAGGLIDDLPDVPGVRDGWGVSVLHCPFCHGWEVRDRRIGILTRDEVAIHQAMLFRQLSDDVTLFLHDAPDPSDEVAEQLAALGVRMVRPRVERLILDGQQVTSAELADGERVDLDAVVVAPVFSVRTELFEALGGQPTTTPFGRHIDADPRGTTAVPGVLAAGNTADPMATVMAAAASGVAAGAATHGHLAAADLAQAVAHRREARGGITSTPAASTS